MDVAERMRKRFGEGVLSWTAALPARLARLAAAWDLTLGDVFPDGASAVTLRVTRAGEPAVLKVSPDLVFAAEQVEVLRAFAPSGRVPAVLAADPDEGAVLLEHVRGTNTWPEPAAFGALLRDLHAAVADPAAVARRDLGGWTGEFLPRFTPTGPVTAAHLATARDRCAELVTTQGAPVLLHGDLHVDNLLDAGPRGPVVLDPKACLGEPEFDAVDFVLAGPDHPARVAALAAATTLDAGRLDAWARALAPVVAVGQLRRGLPVGGLLEYATGE